VGAGVGGSGVGAGAGLEGGAASCVSACGGFEAVAEGQIIQPITPRTTIAAIAIALGGIARDAAIGTAARSGFCRS
jgi:hypothetical protein